MAESRVIDAYLTELRYSVGKLDDADDIVDEAADHLYTALAQLVAGGVAPADAAAQVLGRFGSAALVARVFAEEAKRGGAVSTTLTRRAGVAAMASFPLLAIGQAGNVTVPRGALHGVSLVAILAGFAAFAVGLWGIRRRHGGMGTLGRVAFWWLVASPVIAVPFGWGALAALVIQWLLVMSLLGVAMLRARVLPALAVGLFALSPLMAVAAAGGMTLVQIDAGPYFALLLLPVAIGYSWLGWALSREPALDVRPSEQTGPVATA